jgi:hypothetical protein
VKSPGTPCCGTDPNTWIASAQTNHPVKGRHWGFLRNDTVKLKGLESGIMEAIGAQLLDQGTVNKTGILTPEEDFAVFLDRKGTNAVVLESPLWLQNVRTFVVVEICARVNSGSASDNPH